MINIPDFKGPMTRDEFIQAVRTCPRIYNPKPFVVDWGPRDRKQGRRYGNMIVGGMCDNTLRGKKTYCNVFGNLPDYEQIKNDLPTSLPASHWYMKARDFGLTHELAWIFAFEPEKAFEKWTSEQTEVIQC